jgi:hypothetical protein
VKEVLETFGMPFHKVSSILEFLKENRKGKESETYSMK